MPISGQTVGKLRSLSALICCPLCGKSDQKVESLTACGHYLCAHCVRRHVLSGDNKCPKCFAINYTNDCKDDLYFNSLLKISHKINKLLDQRESKPLAKQSPIKVSAKQVVTKSGDQSKGHASGYQKDLIIQSLKACVADSAKNKQKSGSVCDPKSVNNKPLNKEALKPVIKEALKPVIKESPLKSAPPMTAKPALNARKSVEFVDVVDTDSMDSIESIPNSIEDSYGEPTEISGLNNETTAEDKTTEMASAVLEGLESNNDRLSIDFLDSSFGSHTDGNQSLPTARNASQEKEKAFKKVMDWKSCQTSQHIVDTGMQTQNSPKKVLKSVSIQVVAKLCNQSIQTDPLLDINTDNAAKETTNCCESNNCCFHKSIENIPCHSLQMFLKQLVEFKANQLVTNDNQLAINSDEVKATSEPSVSAKPINEIENREEAVLVPVIDKLSTQDIHWAVKSYSSKRSSFESITRSKKPKTELKSDSNVEEVVELIETDKEVIDENVVNESNERKAKKTASKPKAVRSKREAKAVVEEVVAEEQAVVDNEEVVQSKRKAAKTVPNTSKRSRKAAEQRVPELMAPKVAEESVQEVADDSVFIFEDPPEVVEPKQKPKRKVVTKKTAKSKALVVEEEEDEEPKPVAKNVRKRQIISTESEETPKADTKRTKSKFNPTIASTAAKPEKSVFKRPVSPAPSEAPSDVSMASSTSSRQRTSSSERSTQRCVILYSGLEEKQIKKIQSVCRELNAEAVTEWSDKVTHLVIALFKDTTKEGLICPRNAKYLKALLANKWIVSFDWIMDSYRSNRFVDEFKYEISADRTATEAHIPRRSRTSGQKLFQNIMCHFNGIKGNLLSELQQFVVIGGGVVVDSIEEFAKSKRKNGFKKLLSVSEAIGLPNTQTDGIKYVSRNSLMDSIANFSPL